MRCDWAHSEHKSASWMFQSTHLHEVWQTGSELSLTRKSFNPHTYMRCDPFPQEADSRRNSFNPHTYMRCDLYRHSYRHIFLCFNPHTYMRCDHFIPVWLDCLSGFQSTHLHEVWRITADLGKRTGVFQSTHLHEVWPLLPLSMDTITSFNPHTYMRCDRFLAKWE